LGQGVMDQKKCRIERRTTPKEISTGKRAGEGAIELRNKITLGKSMRRKKGAAELDSHARKGGTKERG